MKAKYILCVICFLSFFVSMVDAEMGTISDEWLQLKKAYFEDKELIKDHSYFELIAPPRAEDAAFTPVRIIANQAQTSDQYVEKLYLFVDKNPAPLVGVYHFGNALDWLDFSTRLRVDRYSYLRAIVVMNTGEHYIRSHYIKASGGCSAPPPPNTEGISSQTGKMRIRIVNKEKVEHLMLQVKHPNNSGLQIDPISRGYIPAHFVTDIRLLINESDFLVDAKTGISVSSDPAITIRLPKDMIKNVTAVVEDSTLKNWQKHLSVE